MIRINLLPKEERKSTLRTGWLYASIFGLLFFSFAFIYAYHAVKILSLENEIQAMQRQDALNRLTQQKMNLAGQKVQSIAVKQQTVETLSQERVSWSAVLTHLSAAMIPEVWLTEVSGEKGVLHLKGGAEDYSFIAMFLQQLSGDSLFTAPTLVNAAKDVKQPMTQFEIAVQVKGL